MSRFYRGHNADPAGMPRTPLYHLIGAPGASPPSASVRDAVLAGPGILDQLSTSSCVGHAIAGAVETRLHVAGTPSGHLSPVSSYTLARCIDRVPDAHGKLPLLTDEGSQPNQAIRALSEWGISTRAVWPLDPATINREIDLPELENAGGLELVGAYGLPAGALLSQRIELVRLALAAGFPVCFAVEVDDAFEANQGEVIGAPGGKILGGHYLYAVGYSTSLGKTIVEFANSWGANSGWGSSGFGLGDEQFMAGWRDVNVMSVKKVGS